MNNSFNNNENNSENSSFYQEEEGKQDEQKQKKMMVLLDKIYSKVINGLPGTKSCEELAEEYLRKYKKPEIAAKKFIKNQITKCTTSGFITGLGGLLTLPVTIPANITSVLYVQMRMIATLAVIGGYNLNDDEVQTLVYLSLVKSGVTDICKSVGIQVTNKFVTLNLLKKVPGTVLTKINQKVGFRLITKFGEKGVVNLVKVVPVLGGIVGGGVDWIGTKQIADNAYKKFLLNNFE